VPHFISFLDRSLLGSFSFGYNHFLGRGGNLLTIGLLFFKFQIHIAFLGIFIAEKSSDDFMHRKV
jgi:hypothetical protein